MKRIVLHIDRLVLTGLPRGDRRAIGESLRKELGLQLSRPQAVRDLFGRHDAPRVRVADVALGSGTSATQVGTRIARGVARGLKP